MSQKWSECGKSCKNRLWLHCNGSLKLESDPQTVLFYARSQLNTKPVGNDSLFLFLRPQGVFFTYRSEAVNWNNYIKEIIYILLHLNLKVITNYYTTCLCKESLRTNKTLFRLGHLYDNESLCNVCLLMQRIVAYQRSRVLILWEICSNLCSFKQWSWLQGIVSWTETRAMLCNERTNHRNVNQTRKHSTALSEAVTYMYM